MLFSPVPVRPPSGVFGRSRRSTTIDIEWQPIIDEYASGVLRGYKISYKEHAQINSHAVQGTFTVTASTTMVSKRIKQIALEC